MSTRNTVAAAIAATLIALPISHGDHASWYGWAHHGRKMANGHPFDAMGDNAASWHFPFGTKLCITNRRNGRQAVVVIEDRGPAAWTGRTIDLSLGTAIKLRMVTAGVVSVLIEPAPCKPRPPENTPKYEP